MAAPSRTKAALLTFITLYCLYFFFLLCFFAVKLGFFITSCLVSSTSQTLTGFLLCTLGIIFPLILHPSLRNSPPAYWFLNGNRTGEFFIVA